MIVDYYTSEEMVIYGQDPSETLGVGDRIAESVFEKGKMNVYLLKIDGTKEKVTSLSQIKEHPGMFGLPYGQAQMDFIMKFLQEDAETKIVDDTMTEEEQDNYAVQLVVYIDDLMGRLQNTQIEYEAKKNKEEDS